MIGLLRGQILESGPGQIILGVGSDELGYVGYSIALPSRPAYQSLIPGRKSEFFIYTHVREDSLDLYGFSTSVEKELFLTLMSVSGIGPKSALTILSKVEPSELLSVIIAGDARALTEFPGIGKKTAERIVVELSEPLKKRAKNGEFRELNGDPLQSAVLGAKASSAVLDEAMAALVGLGYRANEAEVILEKALKSNSAAVSVEELIRTALRQPRA